MSGSPRVVLSAEDIEFLIDECAHIDRGAIAGGLTAHRWLTERHERENRTRMLAKLPRIDFPAFLHLFVNELGPASRARVESRDWDPKDLPEDVSLSNSDRDALRDVLALDVIEEVLWQRSEAAAAQAAEVEARVAAYVARQHWKYRKTQGQEELPPLPGAPRSTRTPWPTDPPEWMLRHAAAQFGITGQKLTRDAGVAACNGALKCGTRAAGDAYKVLPEGLKFKQGRHHP